MIHLYLILHRQMCIHQVYSRDLQIVSIDEPLMRCNCPVGGDLLLEAPPCIIIADAACSAGIRYTRPRFPALLVKIEHRKQQLYRYYPAQHESARKNLSSNAHRCSLARGKLRIAQEGTYVERCLMSLKNDKTSNRGSEKRPWGIAFMYCEPKRT